MSIKNNIRIYGVPNFWSKGEAKQDLDLGQILGHRALMLTLFNFAFKNNSFKEKNTPQRFQRVVLFLYTVHSR